MADNPESRVKTLQSAIAILLIGMALMVLIGLGLTVRGLSLYFPPRLLVFCILGDFLVICVCLSLIKRTRKRDIALTPASGSNRFVTDLVQTLGWYAAFEAVVAGLVLVVVGVRLKTMLWDYLLFLAPALVGLPLIMYARQSFDRPKVCAFRFALAICLFCLSMLVGFAYSGLDHLIGDSGGVGIFTALFGTAFIAVYTYHSTYKRLRLKQSATKAK